MRKYLQTAHLCICPKNINNIKDIVDSAGGFQIIDLNKLEVIDYELCNNKKCKIQKRKFDGSLSP